MTLRVPEAFCSKPGGFTLPWPRSSPPYSAKRRFLAIGSNPSTKSYASPKVTTNFSSKAANGGWSSSPAKGVWTGSWPPSPARLRSSFLKEQAPAFAFVPTHPVGSFSTITLGPDAGAGARCRFAAIAIKSRPFPGADPQAAVSSGFDGDPRAATSRIWATRLSTMDHSCVRRPSGPPAEDASRAKR